MQAEQGQFDQRATLDPRGRDVHSAQRHSIIAQGMPLLSVPLNWFTLVLLCFCGGCSHLRLPAIDPSGSRIFLPKPNSTQFNAPTPAFQNPVAPPPCLDGGVCNLCGQDRNRVLKKLQEHFKSKGKTGEIQLTPLRVVAPVGGEVVLLAGICGTDGYLVKREPLEWMLSPDSVGTFIEVGDDKPDPLTRLLMHSAPKIEKLDVDYARGRTSYKETLITRGSPNCDDDIPLLEGQTWLSISSPSEGVSRVTALAPDSEIWDQRRQTATIYWVDAQWEFPAPTASRTGEPVQLVTRVTKAENLVPAEDWIVEYTIADPNVAAFDPPTGGNKLAVRVNRDAQAIANLISLPGARGTTGVIIDVIRPAQPSDNLPQLVLGRGQTAVTFSAPGLNLEAFGPSVGTVGEQLTYTATLGNPGDVDADNVSLVMTKPVGWTILSTSLQPTQATNDALKWDQGVLAANRQLDVSVVLQAPQRISPQANTFEVVFEAVAAGGLNAQRRVPVEIIETSLEVNFQPVGGVAEVPVGAEIQYAIDITNTGRQALAGLTLLVETDPNLPEATRGENRVQQTISILQPGETRKIGVKFRVQQTGPLNARLQVSLGDQVLAQKTATVQGREPPPKRPDVGISIEFPESIRVGASATARVTLSNPGELRLTNLQVEFAIDPTLRISKVDNVNFSNFQPGPNGQSAIWSAQDLLPALPGSGATVRQILVEFESLAPTQRGTIAVRASAVEGVEASAIANFQAAAVATQPPVEPPVLPQERSGSLNLSLTGFRDPANVGTQVRYSLTLTNEQNLQDRNVKIQIQIPQGVQFEGITTIDGGPVNAQRGQDGSILLPDIRFIRAGERVSYVFTVVPLLPQLLEFRAIAYSDERPTPVQATETTTVNAR